MKKKIGVIKIQIFSGKATPAPPIGPALGQRGLNILNFCKKFNDETKNISPPVLLPVLINYYSDKTFDFLIKKPNISFLIKNLLKLDKFSSNHKQSSLFSLDFYKVKDLIEYKILDLNTSNFYSALKTIYGSLKSFNISLNYNEFD